MRSHLLPLLFLLASGAAQAAPPASAPATAAPVNPEAYNIAPVADKLLFFSDGAGKYIAIVPPFTIKDGENPLFYSADGKTFLQQRPFGSFRNGEESWDVSFWEPRLTKRSTASFGLQSDKRVILDCNSRETEWKPVAAADAAKLKGAAFLKPSWKRRAYALARDNTGVYYYVDQAREPEGNKDFRVFRGEKGKIKLQKMLNIVSDSAGDIFVTKGGELRLVLDTNERLWVANQKKTDLTLLPVENNAALIYGELGVYLGERLGTPCDDF